MPSHDVNKVYLIEKLHAPREVKKLLRDGILAQHVSGSVKAKIEVCISEGYLRACTTAEKIVATMSASEMKDELGGIGLRPKGSKLEMASMLLRGCEGKFERQYIDKEFVVATEKGEDYARNIRDQADETELLLIPRIYALLLKDQYREARRLADDHYRVHPQNTRHMQANFNQGHLDDIRKAKPAFAKAIAENDLQVLRSAAIIKSLWDFYDISSLLRDGAMFGNLRPETAVSYMINHARIKEMARSNSFYGGQITVQFRGRDSDSCHLCRACANRNFTVGSLPDFPLAGCTSSVGCGLIAVPSEDADTLEASIPSNEREDDRPEGGIAYNPQQGTFSIAIEMEDDDSTGQRTGSSVLSVFMKRGVITCNDLIEALYERGRISEAERDRLRE